MADNIIKVKLKDADGNVLHPETELKMIKGAQEAYTTPGFFVFGTYEEQEDEDVWDDYPAFGLYRFGGIGGSRIIKAFYVNNSGNIVAITDLTQFKPMKDYFAQ